MQAIVYKSTGSWYSVQTQDGVMHNARIKGKFKIKGITSTNPIAVGDIVEIEKDAESDDVIIVHIHNRKNYINRVSPHNKNQHHIVASNLDQSLLFATVREPKTSLGFIDRFLVTCEAFHIPAIIVFNKADIYSESDMDYFHEVKSIYENIGYKVFLISVQTQSGMDELSAILKDKVTLISGHSGVGKSTFINYLFPQLNLKTLDVSGWSGKGMHSTTFAEMFDIPLGGKIIDTPGIKELGIADISKEELSHYFPEMLKIMDTCKFNNCLHENEPGCAVKDAVNNESIHPERYISYLSIKDSILDKPY